MALLLFIIRATPYSGMQKQQNILQRLSMAIERTFSIIKPNAVAKNVIGSIFARFESAGFKIVGTKMLHLTVEQARGFYAEHEGRPFFDGLVEFMTSGYNRGIRTGRRKRGTASPRSAGCNQPGQRAGRYSAR